MLNKLMKNFVMTKDSVPSWEQAIQEAAQPLVEAKYITEHYITKMIDNVKELGPYIVIMPRVALPHSRAADGALKTGVSLLKLKEAVLFPEDKHVELIVVLAANDDIVHMQLLSELVDVFMDENKMERIFQAETKEELLGVL